MQRSTSVSHCANSQTRKGCCASSRASAPVRAGHARPRPGAWPRRAPRAPPDAVRGCPGPRLASATPPAVPGRCAPTRTPAAHVRVGVRVARHVRPAIRARHEPRCSPDRRPAGHAVQPRHGPPRRFRSTPAPERNAIPLTGAHPGTPRAPGGPICARLGLENGYKAARPPRAPNRSRPPKGNAASSAFRHRRRAPAVPPPNAVRHGVRRVRSVRARAPREASREVVAPPHRAVSVATPPDAPDATNPQATRSRARSLCPPSRPPAPPPREWRHARRAAICPAPRAQGFPGSVDSHRSPPTPDRRANPRARHKPSARAPHTVGNANTAWPHPARMPIPRARSSRPDPAPRVEQHACSARCVPRGSPGAPLARRSGSARAICPPLD